MDTPERNERFAVLFKNTLTDFIEKPHIVIGCGAIGGYVIKILGQIGVEYLHLWDDDTVEEVSKGIRGIICKSSNLKSIC